MCTFSAGLGLARNRDGLSYNSFFYWHLRFSYWNICQSHFFFRLVSCRKWRCTTRSSSALREQGRVRPLSRYLYLDNLPCGMQKSIPTHPSLRQTVARGALQGKFHRVLLIKGIKGYIRVMKHILSAVSISMISASIIFPFHSPLNFFSLYFFHPFDFPFFFFLFLPLQNVAFRTKAWREPCLGMILSMSTD